MFSLGLEPTGSKDPFALRRAANGIVKILAESRLPIRLGEVVSKTAADATTEHKVATFLNLRLQSYMSEVSGYSYDVVRAVLSSTSGLPDDVRDVLARAKAVSEAKGSADFLSVCAAFKRMKGIVDQARENGEYSSSEVANPQGNVEAQQKLFDAAQRVASSMDALVRSYDYTAALLEMATLRSFVDTFMNGHQVRDEKEPLITLGRLRLLDLILSRLKGIADFSEIVVSG